MLDEQDRVIRADGRFEQALGVFGRAGADDLKTGEMCKDCVRGLRVGRAKLTPAAADSADHHRDFELSAKHIV